MQQKTLVLFLWRTRALIRLSWCHHHLPHAGPQSVRSLLVGLNRRTITDASEAGYYV
jgi:hypothetical protein